MFLVKNYKIAYFIFKELSVSIWHPNIFEIMLLSTFWMPGRARNHGKISQKYSQTSFSSIINFWTICIGECRHYMKPWWLSCTCLSSCYWILLFPKSDFFINMFFSSLAKILWALFSNCALMKWTPCLYLPCESLWIVCSLLGISRFILRTSYTECWHYMTPWLSANSCLSSNHWFLLFSLLTFYRHVIFSMGKTPLFFHFYNDDTDLHPYLYHSVLAQLFKRE